MVAGTQEIYIYIIIIIIAYTYVYTYVYVIIKNYKKVVELHKFKISEYYNNV